MSKLRFDIARSPVPVEVFDEDLALRTRTLTSETIDVPPGRYHVVARLPSGEQRMATVDVGAKPAVASLRRKRAPTSRASSGVLHARRQELSTERRLQEDDLSWLGEPEGRGREGVLRTGKTGGGRWALVGAVVFHMPRWAGEVYELRLKREDRVAQRSIVPLNAERLLKPAVTKDAFGEPRLATQLRKRIANEMMAYLNQGQLIDAGLMSRRIAPDAELALQGKSTDPLAAAAGALTLLTLGELDRLHDWTANLHNWFRWLPDAAVVYAEHLAREGRHEEALDPLLRLNVQGLPCLTMALTTAVDRLSMYASADFGGDLLVQLSERLTRYALACDLTATIVSFYGEASNPLPRGALHGA